MAVLAQNTITLIRVDDGTDGKGVASITRQYYVSTSKIAPTGGSWTTTAPAWSLGKYLWTRYEIKYTNPSSTVYTTAYCDSSWEAINEIQMGGRNYLINSNFSKTYTSSYKTSKEEQIEADDWGGYNGGIENPTTSYHAHVDTDTFGYNVYEFNESDGSRNWKGIRQTITDRFPNDDSQYIFSCDAYATGSGGKIYGGIYYTKENRSSSTFASGQFFIDDEISANEWSRVSVVVPWNNDAKENSPFSFYIYGYNFTSDVIVYIKNVKLEKGNKATDWTPAPEDTAMSIDEIHNQLDGIDNIITNTQTNFEQKIDSITSTVEQTQQAVVDYQGQLTQIRTDISTEIEQVASGLSLTIEEIYNQFSDLGDVTETIRTFFKVTSDGLMIAQDGNPTSTLMGYDHFAVLLNNAEVVKIYQDSMQAPNGIFDSSVTIGPIKFEGYSEGVALKWVGD